jgi:hypothetical protein
MPTTLLEITVEENCLYCGQNFLIVAKGTDQYGNVKLHAKCRYCGANAYDKIGINDFVHLEGKVLERVIEYLHEVSPLKFTKKGTK